MVKIIIEKKQLAEAATVLAACANVKSIGALPGDASAIYLTPTTMTIINKNEANMCVVENIPINIEEGDINAHIEKAYMINTKKFASIIKSSKKVINFLITDSVITIGEGNRRFELSVHTTIKKDIDPIKLMDTSISTKDILKNFSNSGLITTQSVHINEMIGTLFSTHMMLSSDRMSALYIKDNCLFPKGVDQDMVMGTDLFSAVLPKIKETSAFVGYTTDGKQLCLQIGNITLGKRCLANNFPKEQLLQAIQGVENMPEAAQIKAVVNLKDFIDKLHEIKEIVEAEDYVITVRKDSTVSIEQNNKKNIGAEGIVYVDATTVLPEDCGEALGAKFSFIHLDMLGKIFAKEKEVEIISTKINKEGVDGLKLLCVRTDKQTFMCSARV